MMEVKHLCWFYRVWWEEQARYIDCLVDLSIKPITGMNDGIWLVKTEAGLSLKSANWVGSEVVLGKARQWSIKLC